MLLYMSLISLNFDYNNMLPIFVELIPQLSLSIGDPNVWPDWILVGRFD